LPVPGSNGDRTAPSQCRGRALKERDHALSGCGESGLLQQLQVDLKFAVISRLQLEVRRHETTGACLR
jgi:hypothetical protein